MAQQLNLMSQPFPLYEKKVHSMLNMNTVVLNDLQSVCLLFGPF
jgi:hypothetical protein